MKGSPVLLIALLLLGYALPWVTTPLIAGFTNSAYDIAEWVSIIPIVRADSLLLTPLLLRIPLVCIAAFIAISDVRRSTRWLRLLGLLVLAFALLPPLEYFTSASGDANYQQLFMLASATLLLGSMGALLVDRLDRQIVATLRVAVILAALLSGGMGLARALPLLQSFGIDSQIGIGAIGFSIASVVCIAWSLWRQAQNAQPNETG